MLIKEINSETYGKYFVECITVLNPTNNYHLYSKLKKEIGVWLVERIDPNNKWNLRIYAAISDYPGNEKLPIAITREKLEKNL